MTFREYIKKNRFYINRYSIKTYGYDINKELGRLATKFEKQPSYIQKEIVDTFNYISSFNEDLKETVRLLNEMVIDLVYQL